MDQLGRGWNAGCSGSPTGPGPTTWQRQAHESGGSRKRRVRVRWGHQSGRKKSGPRGKPPPGRGRCNFDTIRGSPASSTLTPKPGALQGWSGAPIIPTAGVHWPGTARHLLAQDTGRHPDCPLVLLGIPYHVQFTARLLGSAAAGDARRIGSGGCCGRADAESDQCRRPTAPG